MDAAQALVHKMMLCAIPIFFEVIISLGVSFFKSSFFLLHSFEKKTDLSLEVGLALPNMYSQYRRYRNFMNYLSLFIHWFICNEKNKTIERKVKNKF